MELYQAIRSRRSCRAFRPDPVPREAVERVLEAATWAPSGKNRQNWMIYAVAGEGRERLVEISRRTFPDLEPSLRRLYPDRVVEFTRRFFQDMGGAPVVLAFYSQPSGEGELVDLQSVAASIQNALLAATAEGLGSCWMTQPVLLASEVDRVLGVEGMELVALVPLGYPRREPPAPPRREGRVQLVGFR